MVKHISCDWKCKLNSITCNSNQKWDKDACQYKCKWYRAWKKDFSWNYSTCICQNSRYLKVIVDDSVTVCDEIINFTDSISKNVKNTILTNVMNTVLINSDSKSSLSTLFN